MAGSGKHPHDSGRARAARFRDRAQLEFDDLLIDSFLEGDADPRDNALDHVPIRFDSQHLATHLSDSAIASAMLDAGVFEENLRDDSIPISSELQFDLFDLLAEKELAGVKESVTKASAAAPVIRPGRERAHATATDASTERMKEFSIRRFVQGFAFGVVAAGAALAIIRVIF
ncbi:MAG: hypothetical protein H6817_09605 [Phycisphaerales bacterium]|nr:hypothetical protein [Phycisphaerales bacterium]